MTNFQEKICFVSFQQPGHMDFGGNSFTKLASILMTKNYNVTWVFSAPKIKVHEQKVKDSLRSKGIKFYEKQDFHLTIEHHDLNIEDEINVFYEYIQQENYS